MITTSDIKIEYCKCERVKVYIAFRPDSEIKLQCIVCDKPKS